MEEQGKDQQSKDIDQLAKKVGWFGKLARPSRLGLLYILAGLIVYIQAASEPAAASSNLLVIVAVFLFSMPLAAPLFAWLNVRGIRVKRTVPDTVQVGETFEVRYLLTTRSRIWPSFLIEAIQQDSPVLAITEKIAVGAYLSRRAARQIEVSAVLLRRGIQSIESLSIQSTFPMGMATYKKVHLLSDEVLVRPRTIGIPGWLSRRLRELAKGEGTRRVFQRGSEDLYGLREFHEGDSLSRVHWPSTARLGSPVVREMEAFANHICMIVLDTVTGSRSIRRSSTERCVSLAASLADELSHQGINFGFAHFGSDLMHFPPERGNRQRHRVLDYLAVAEKGETPVNDWLPDLMSRSAPDVRWIVISSEAPELQIREESARRGQVVLNISLDQPQIQQMFRDAAMLSRRIAAGESLDEIEPAVLPEFEDDEEDIFEDLDGLKGGPKGEFEDEFDEVFSDRFEDTLDEEDPWRA